MHMVYTTYLSKMKNIPVDAMKVVIMRSAPMSAQGQKNMIIKQELSPEFETLMAYKRDNDWELFTERFTNQMETDGKILPILDRIIRALEHNPVALICCEKDENVCHRSILAKKLKSLGARVIEIEKGEY